MSHAFIPKSYHASCICGLTEKIIQRGSHFLLLIFFQFHPFSLLTGDKDFALELFFEPSQREQTFSYRSIGTPKICTYSF